MAIISDLIGRILEAFTGDLGTGEYERVGGGASDYGLYDPTGVLGSLSTYLSGLQGAPAQTSQYDPNAWMTAFGENWGTISGLVGAETDKLRSDLLTGKSTEARQAAELASEQFGGAGESGAMAAALGTAMAQPFADVASKVAESRLGLLGSLGGQAMGLGAQAGQYADTSAQGWAGLGQQREQSILEGLLGLGGLGTSVVAPTYVQDEGSGWLSRLLGAL
jgi:hypothetical protein